MPREGDTETEVIETGHEPVAEQTSSPDVTEGASTSEAAAPEEKSTADAIRDAFLEKFGDGTGKDDQDTSDEGGDEEEPEETADAERSQAPESEAKPGDAGAKDDGDGEFRLSDEEFAKLPDGARKRIGHLNARAKRAERELADLQPVAQRMDELEGFVRENGIEAPHLSAAFGMMAKLAQGDFKGFLSDIQPYVDHARSNMGEIIPDDLMKMVEDGDLTEEAAKRFALERAQRSQAEARAEKSSKQLEQVNAQTASQRAVAEIASALQEHEASLSSREADWPALSPVVQRLVRTQLEAGVRPQSKEAAIQMVDQAVVAAREIMAALPKPQRQPTPPRPTAATPTGGTSTAATPRDAMISALTNYRPAAR